MNLGSIGRLDRAVPFRVKVFGGTTVLMLLLTLALLLATRAVVRDRFSEVLEARGKTVLHNVARPLAPLVFSRSEGRVRAILEDLANDPDVAYAELVTMTGTALHQTNPAERPGFYAELDEGARIARHERRDKQIHFQEVVRTETGTTGPGGLLGGRTSGEIPVGLVRMTLTTVAIERAQRDLLYTLAVTALPFLLGAVGLVLLLGRILAGPLTGLASAAARIAEGDLTRQVPVVTRDELGHLAAAFNEMVSRLSEMVFQVRRDYGRTLELTAETQESLDALTVSREEQALFLETVLTSVSAMNNTVREIVGDTNQLDADADASSTSVLELAATVDEVSGSVDGLSRASTDIASSTERLVSAVAQIDGKVGTLRAIVQDTEGALDELEGRVREVHSHADEARATAEALAETASSGKRAVGDTVASIDSIRESVERTAGVVNAFQSRSREIGSILGVIEDIAENTNLLALNASIIAAQAGEHGKGFSVVASEIRDLSLRTATSTHEIAQLLRGLEEDTTLVVEGMEAGLERVQSGVQVARVAERGLAEILDGARESSSRVDEIAAASTAQLNYSGAVRDLMNRVRADVDDIAEATGEQAAGGTQLLRTGEEVRRRAAEVDRAGKEQRTGAHQIAAASESIARRAQSIHQATDQLAAASDIILRTLDGFHDQSQVVGQRVEGMRLALEVLEHQSVSLRTAIERFTLPSSPTPTKGDSEP